MNTAIGLAFLVVIAVLEEATGFPEQQHDLEYQGQDYDEEYLERKLPGCGTKSACKFSGGWCKPLTEECEGKWRTARFYCKNSRKCGCCIPAGPPGCVFSGKSYPDKALNRETCVDLVCNKGVWESQGIITGDCGTCEVAGDPHIKPYEYHNLTNIPADLNPPWPSYLDSNDGKMVLSQPGLNIPAMFGVDAEFEACPTWEVGKTCVSKVFYQEPGIKVELILPKNLSDWYLCYNDTSNWGKPECSTTKINVAGWNEIIVDGAPARLFYADGGTVLIFTKKCDIPSTHCQYIYVVGSKGYSVVLKVDPSWNLLYQLSIYATPNLHNQIFGLCDVFTGTNANVNGFTNQDGTLTTNYDNLFTKFTPSWKVQNP